MVPRPQNMSAHQKHALATSWKPQRTEREGVPEILVKCFCRENENALGRHDGAWPRRMPLKAL